MAAKGGQKDAKKEPEFTQKTNFWDSCAQGLILTCFLLNLEAIYARKTPNSFGSFEAGSKMANYVSTAPARADRGSDPPEKLTKTPKKRSANQHTYNTDFTPKSNPKYNDETDENLTARSPSRPSLPKPLYLTS